MADIALLWDSNLLLEKFFVEHGLNCRLVHPASIGSPHLPKFKMVMIPTGFANPQYSGVLSYLIRKKHYIERFIEKGGTLVVYGPMTQFHSYEWLPVSIEYIHRCGQVELSHEVISDASLLAGDTLLECDGSFGRAEGECVLVNGEPVLVRMECARGQVIATTIHEFPTPEFIWWALECSNPASL